MLRLLTAGESHGELLTAILDGFPAGVKVSDAYIREQLRRRREAPGRGPRMGRETDAFAVTAGRLNGATTGAPVALTIKNSAAAAHKASGVARPGHADMAGMLKYGTLDAALIRERASARETAARVAAGCFAVRLLEELGARLSSRVVEVGGSLQLREENFGPVIDEARAAGDTLGGVFEVHAEGVPAGLGSYSQGGLRLGARLAAAMFSIPSVKGFEVGAGFGLAAERGSAAAALPELTGGLDGGLTNGRRLELRCAVKPVPGLKAGARSKDFAKGRTAVSASGTSDVTSVFAAAVIAEHAAALCLAGAVLEKFGGDSLPEIKERVDAWRIKTAKFLK